MAVVDVAKYSLVDKPLLKKILRMVIWSLVNSFSDTDPRNNLIYEISKACESICDHICKSCFVLSEIIQ